MSPADTDVRSGAPELTAEIFVIPGPGGRQLVFAPRQRAAFLCNDSAVSSLADLAAKRQARDRSTVDAEFVGFLRSLRLVDGPPDALPEPDVTGDPRPTSVTLFMTTACNLRCTYCYASAGDTPGEFMPLSTALQGIDFIVDNARALGEKQITVAYHGGGEATANWDVMTDSWEYAAAAADRYGLTLRALTATNAAIPEAKAAWIAEHLDGASVSFDGLPHLHDLQRPSASGRGSSASIERTLELFDRVGFDYQLRLTVTEALLPFLAVAVQYLCDNFSAKRIQLEPVYPEGRGSDLPAIDPDRFVELFLEAESIGRAYGRTVYFSAARFGMVTRHFCGVTRDSFALTPTGDVSACYEAFSDGSDLAGDFFYGRLSGGKGVQLDPVALSRLRARTVDKRPYCEGCFAKWSCAGDCHVKHMAHEGSEHEPPRCRITRAITRHQILERISEHGGLFWHEPAPEQS
ncbi:MAG: SPASM domain-containing protein [Gemmatimonadota bacterium]|nr:SPASM domain-containing protein [Gemmatimonadota bacterium]